MNHVGHVLNDYFNGPNTRDNNAMLWLPRKNTCLTSCSTNNEFIYESEFGERAEFVLLPND